MNSFETTFLSETTERAAFIDLPAQFFFTEWCKINDSIIPQFISREEWQKRKRDGILQKNGMGKQNIFLPHDLHLWEMMGIIKTIDQDTFANKAEKHSVKADNIRKLGKIFEKAGLYLNEYSDFITPVEVHDKALRIVKDQQGNIIRNEGNEAVLEQRYLSPATKNILTSKRSFEAEKAQKIARHMAREFYQYGLSLQHQEKSVDELPEANVKQLSSQEKEELDIWFLGEKAYDKRKEKLGNDVSEEEREKQRKRILQKYFIALAKEGHQAQGEKVWETNIGPMKRLQDTTKKQIIRALETPETEMKTAIFRRGIEKLLTEMRQTGWKKTINDVLRKMGIDLVVESRRLYDILRIDKLKEELKEIRVSGDREKISEKELEIAKKIHKQVCSLPYKSYMNQPSEMIETQSVNCVGSSLLGGAFLDELGIKYLNVDLSDHMVTILITADEKAYWQDFTPPGENHFNYCQITPDMIEGDVNISTLANLTDTCATLYFKKIKINDNAKIVLSSPEIGLHSNVLNNTAGFLFLSQRYEEALEAYRQAIHIDPKNSSYYHGLGNAFFFLKRYEEAMESYKEAIHLDPENSDHYHDLGSVFYHINRNQEAIQLYRKAIQMNPQNFVAYDSLANVLSDEGRETEAIEAYKKFISVLNINPILKSKAEDKIEELQDKIAKKRIESL